MSLQLITPCEALATEDPVTDERPLASVQTHMRSEKGCFPERLLTARDMADVLPLFQITRPVYTRHGRTKY